jgi:hypothetical protein
VVGASFSLNYAQRSPELGIGTSLEDCLFSFHSEGIRVLIKHLYETGTIKT